MKAMEVCHFGPPLIVDGKDTEYSGSWGVGPRTAISQKVRYSAILVME